MSEFDPKTFLTSLTARPGVYQMVNADDEILYVGKARNLKHRVSSYFRENILDPKTRALVEQIDHIVVIITKSENEALLLENNLIKKHKPRYNILLRDDKSYPFLFLSIYSEFPRLDIHRGPQREKGRYFGPYPSAGAVRETLDLLQKLFKIRQCSDTFFKSRTRPCLQYQIKRCTAPCVAYIDKDSYQKDVHHAELFLEGKSNEIINELATKMETSAKKLLFEDAAVYRDQLINLRRIQERQVVDLDTRETDIDVMAVVSRGGVFCVHILFIRNGLLIGNKSHFPSVPPGMTDSEVLAEFLPQYYLSESRGESFPKSVIVNVRLEDRQWIENALSEQLHIKLSISELVRGNRKRLLDMTIENAQHALATYLAGKLHFHQRLESFRDLLKLPNLPQRLECYDISHTMGEATVAACVVFDPEGPLKKAYRRYNITGIKQGDDYAAIRQALTRRFALLKTNEGVLPDVLIIDGGKGQLAAAEEVLEELQVSGLTLIAIAKGPTRKAGEETIFISGSSEPLSLPSDSPALHLIQQIRDEAHRFAITGHRQKRAKARMVSSLESIPGIGSKRRRELLRHFGGFQEIQNASAEELAKVSGISLDLAKRIYDTLHESPLL